MQRNFALLLCTLALVLFGFSYFLVSLLVKLIQFLNLMP